jgi:hypothetical protein
MCDGDGDSYWTDWSEDPDSYCVMMDDPAPNKMSISIGFHSVAGRFRDELREHHGLDPDKYEFINWAITCDVQVKEEDKA